MTKIAIMLAALVLALPTYAKDAHKAAPHKKHQHHGLVHQTAHGAKVVGKTAWHVLY